jgi:hypothetical protein
MDGRMTPLQIETAARRMLNASSSNFWSSEEIIENYLYFAALELSTRTRCIENRYTTTSVASQQEYAKPSRMVSVKRVEYSGRKLMPISFRKLDSINYNTSTTVTGTPQYYYFFDDVLGLFPAPSAAGDTIKSYSYDEENALTDSSTLEIPTQYHVYLVIGTAYYMTLKELGHPQTDRFFAKWEDSITKVLGLERLRNKDAFHQVMREEDLPSTLLGAV